MPSATAISQACTAASRAQAPAAVAADRAPWGSGVGTASSSARTLAHAIRPS